MFRVHQENLELLESRGVRGPLEELVCQEPQGPEERRGLRSATPSFI